MSKDEVKKKSKLIKEMTKEEAGKFSDKKPEQLEKVMPIERNIQEEIKYVRKTSEKDLEKKGKIIKG